VTNAPNAQPKQPLDELMLAMDVVDTLRHRETVLQRELSSDEQDAALRDRLREIYAAQGIDVPDAVIDEGVQALRRDRFAYDPVGDGFSRWLAERYVSRAHWGPLLLGVLLLAALVWGGYHFLIERPARVQAERLPAELAQAFEQIDASSDDAAALEQAEMLYRNGRSALERQDAAQAATALAELEQLERRLNQTYELRVVSRPGEVSGVWRIPDVNSDARNYYLIVEALTPAGERLSLPIRSEEDGTVAEVERFGLRVDADTFQRFAQDKQADGIVDEPVVGSKPRGQLAVDYTVSTDGGAITEW
jgi:hypothetical protein